MNIFERQAKFQRELFQIQLDTSKELMNLTEESTRKYLSLNEEFASRMPQPTDISGWTEVQREYGETVMSGYQEYMQTSGEILKGAMESWNEAMKSAFTPEAEAPVEEAA